MSSPSVIPTNNRRLLPKQHHHHHVPSAPVVATDPYDIGIGAGDILARRRKKNGKAKDSSLRSGMNKVHLVMQVGDTYRRPNLADPVERQIVRRMALRVRRRRDRLDSLKSMNEDGYGVAQEREAIESLLLRFHDLVPIDVNGTVPKVARALGPFWEATDPNAARPYLRRSPLPSKIPDRTRTSRRLTDIIITQLNSTGGHESRPEVAVERSIGILLGPDDPDNVRELLRPIVAQVVERCMAAGASQGA